jgi:hypothetical protein
MRIVITMGLAFLFAGASVLGVVRAVAFCLSADGDVQPHVVLLDGDIASAASDCAVVEMSVCGVDCPPYTDFVIESAELVAARSANPFAGSLPLPMFSIGAQSIVADQPVNPDEVRDTLDRSRFPHITVEILEPLEISKN